MGMMIVNGSSDQHIAKSGGECKLSVPRRTYLLSSD